MRSLPAILLVGLLAAGCTPGNDNRLAEELLEGPTPVTFSTNKTLEHPSFPLKCEAVGTEGPGGVFMPIMLLSSPIPRGGSETRSVVSGRPGTIKVFRGTNRIAASNFFLGEFQVDGFEKGAEESRVNIGFNLTAQQRLFLYATDEKGLKRLAVHRVNGTK